MPQGVPFEIYLVILAHINEQTDSSQTHIDTIQAKLHQLSQVKHAAGGWGTRTTF